MKRYLLKLAAIALACIGLNAHAASPAEDAVTMVNDAIKTISTDGKEKAFAAISDPKGAFVKGEVYLFIVANDGSVLAHGGNPKLIGKSLKELRDADGKLFIQEMIDQAKKAPGWVDYKWTNPTTKKIQAKTTYVAPVPGVEAMIGCGIYK
jgi:cytochrome c